MDQDPKDELIADIRERVLFLKEIGVEGLDVQMSERAVESKEAPIEHDAAPLRAVPPRPIVERPTAEPKVEKPAGSRLSSLPSLSKLTQTSALGREPVSPVQKGSNDNYRPADLGRDAEDDADLTYSISPSESMPRLREPTETIEAIREEIGRGCMRCKLSTLGRSQVVNSVGNFNADLMFVGEAPGADEDAKGEPFVGRAGQLLTDIIEKGLQIKRSDVFIGNINRCRPPGNRAPEPDETVVCKPFLLREVAVIRPKVIVVLGATAAHNLLETKTPISKMRGRFHDYLGVKVMPTFHPAYLLRDPRKKREVWEDMKIVRDYLNTFSDVSKTD